ncbi:CLIP-associating protein 1-B-like isoform X2 [Tachypleus tridentatus]|uniref:CLIP-associating protein 1-B-like isoform X2 n=1 Tax=Tachypleus tridentatus TaxID=6853 RepID=UPI003FD262BF
MSENCEVKMASLDEFLKQLVVQDTKKRIQLGEDIISYLENPSNTIECEEFGDFIDSVASWVNNSNFKVSQNGLTILGLVADRMKDDFRPYISTVLSATVDRMGDSRDQVRQQAKKFLLKLMSDVSSPQHMFEKLMPVFSHKNWKVREEMLICLKDALVSYGSHSLALSKMMPSVVKLLSDPNLQVRETASHTIIEIYKHVGEKVRQDLTKRQNIPAAKLQTILSKFDEIKTSGDLLPSALLDQGSQKGDDDTDSRSQSSKSSAKRASSAPPPRKTMLSTPKRTSTLQQKRSPKNGSEKTTVSAAVPAGAADEEMFMKAFEDVPRVQLYSGRELENQLGKIKEILSNPNNEWGKRIEAMKRLRSFIIAGATEYEELYLNLRQLEVPFQTTLKDLRSQVVREACITIAFLSQQLGSKLDHFSEAVLQSLINLIPNSAKIMSTAGIVAVHFIIQHTHCSRLIPVIVSNLSSKSKDIRKVCVEFLDQLLHIWPTHTLEKHIGILQEAIRKGISDANPEARVCSRKAFWGFADHFREQADSLLSSLDSNKQRMIQDGGLFLTCSSSNNSLSGASKGGNVRVGSPSTSGSVENLSQMPAGGSSRRSGIPISNALQCDPSYVPSTFRSNSAIDVAAAKRAKIRAYGTITQPVRGSAASLAKHNSRGGDNNIVALTSPERLGRPKSKGVSQSQPSSRSGSPSSRLSYNTYQEISSSGRVRRKSGIPLTTGTSRETSPARSLHGGHERRPSGTYRSRPFIGAGERYHPTTITTSTPVMAEKILQQSKEAEAAMADALVSDGFNFDPCLKSPRRRFNAFDDQSDESETSSASSDRSFGSYGGRHLDDVPEIIHNLGSIHWSERKEGLLGLCALLRSSRMLSPGELKRVTDTFTKLFMDPHTKVFTLFLDTLNELIRVHHVDLYGWLYVLLTRLFIKSGTDIVTSVQTKIKKTLDLIRDCFSSDKLFHVIIRFLNDPTQTPNNKAKLTMLQYLNSVLKVMDPSEFLGSNSETKQAVTKVISWTTDTKNSDLRRFSQDIIMGLFNVNTPEFSMLLNQLPKSYQDSAFKLLSSRRRSSTDSNISLGVRNPPSPVTSNLHSSSATSSRSETPQDHSLEYDDTENLNSEEIFNSLKMTSAEIQKYSETTYEKEYNSKDERQKLKDNVIRDSGPQDSGNSYSSSPDGRQDSVHERLKLLRIQSPKYSSNYYKEQDREDGVDRDAYPEPYFDQRELEDDSVFGDIVTELNNHNTRNEPRKQALTRLIYLAKEDHPGWEDHFRNILRLLIATMTDADGSVRTLALKTLCELLKMQAQRFHGYGELTILKILDAHKDPEKEVQRTAEMCSEVAATVLPAELCVRTLCPMIKNGEYPSNHAAIKMLTKLVEQQQKNIILQLLPNMMPALVQAYDNTESSVRKAAVFCMVAIHSVVSDSMKPYLSSLNGSKMKLLNLYIKRNQSSGRSTPGSPASSATFQ